MGLLTRKSLGTSAGLAGAGPGSSLGDGHLLIVVVVVTSLPPGRGECGTDSDERLFARFCPLQMFGFARRRSAIQGRWLQECGPKISSPVFMHRPPHRPLRVSVQGRRAAAHKSACASRVRIYSLCVCLVAWCLPQSSAQASREYDLKAVFLYNLASFVTWPKDAFVDPREPFVIGVLGNDPFGALLDEVVEDEYVVQHPFLVRRYTRVSDIATCHLLFVCSSESRRVDQVLRHIRGTPILTVAEFPEFLEAGGMVRLAMEQSHLELYINPRAMTAASLEVSSKLLEVAHVVDADALVP